MFDLIVKGGTLPDGRVADIGIRGDRIAAIEDLSGAEAGEVIEHIIVQDTPEFWFLAIARCQEWVDVLEAATPEGDQCMGSRTYGNVPNGVFMYYELQVLCAFPCAFPPVRPPG